MLARFLGDPEDEYVPMEAMPHVLVVGNICGVDAGEEEVVAKYRSWTKFGM